MLTITLIVADMYVYDHKIGYCHGISTVFRLKDILPLIYMTAEFLKLTGPVVMPTLIAHRSSSIKFVIIKNTEYVS